MNFKSAISVAAAAAVAVSMVGVAASAEDVTVELDSKYVGDWGRSAGIEKEQFTNFSGDVKVVLQVETVNVKDGASYLIKPMDVDKSWDAITSKLTAEKGVTKPDGFIPIRYDQTEVEFVVPQAVVNDLWNGGIAFQVSNVIVKSATLSDGSAENAFVTIKDGQECNDYCAGKFDPFAAPEEPAAEETTLPAEEAAPEAETTTAATEAVTEEESLEEEPVEEELVEEEVEEEPVEEADEEPAEEEAGVDLSAVAPCQYADAITVAGEGSASGAWGQSNVMYTYLNIKEDEEPGPNPFDTSLLNADNVIVVNYEADSAPELILQSWSGGEGWAKVPANPDYSQDGVAVFTYDYMTAMYGTEDFSLLDAVNIGDTGTPLTVSGVYVVPMASLEGGADEATVPAETADETPAEATAPATTVAADTSSPKTGNMSAAAIAAIMVAAGGAAALLRKKK